MSEEKKALFAEELKDMLDRKIRVDVSPSHLDPYFVTHFLLYWLASQPISLRSGKAVVIDLLQAGMRAKFDREDALIKEKLQMYCAVRGITLKELLEAIRLAIGYEISALNEDDIRTKKKPLFDLGEK